MAGNQDVSTKLKETLDMAARGFEAEKSDGYYALQEELEATQNEVKTSMQTHRDQDLIILVSVGGWIRARSSNCSVCRDGPRAGEIRQTDGQAARRPLSVGDRAGRGPRPGGRGHAPGRLLLVAGGAAPRYASSVFDVSSPCCEVAVTPPSRRALDWSSQ